MNAARIAALLRELGEQLGLELEPERVGRR